MKQDPLARIVQQLHTIWGEMVAFWGYMLHHDRLQRQAIKGTVREALEKVRGGR